MKRFFKVKNLIFVTFLAIAGFFSTAAISSNIKSEETPVVEKADASGSTAQNQDATRIWSQDQMGYSYCALRVYSISYAKDDVSGHQYNNDDLEYYFGQVYGARFTGTINTTNIYQYKDGKRWARKVSGTKGDYFVVNILAYTLGDTNKPETEVILPWWVTGFKFQTWNGDYEGERPTSGCTVSTSWGYKHYLNCYLYGNRTYDTHQDTDCKLDFDAWNVTIERKLTNGESLGNLITNQARSSFDYYYPSDSTDYEGYTFGGFYIDEELSETYSAVKLTEDTTLYAKYTPSYSTIANNKVRLWITYYNSKNDSGDYFDSGLAKIKVWTHKNQLNGDDGQNVYESYTTVNNAADGRRYDYFDINLSDYTSGWYLTIQRFKSDYSEYWGATDNSNTYKYQLSSSNVGKVCSILCKSYTWYISAEAVNSCDAKTAALAICGLHTCSKNEYNGNRAYSNYKSTFYDKIKSGESLSTWYINDFREGDTSYTGVVDKVTNAETKYQWLAYEAGAGSRPLTPGLGNFGGVFNNDGSSDGFSVIIIIVASSVALLSITALSVLVVKKRKSKEQ